MLFNLFKKKVWKEEKRPIYVCKHCKLTCKSCDAMYCFTCHMNESNPCPRCGKRNIDYVKEKKS